MCIFSSFVLSCQLSSHVYSCSRYLDRDCSVVLSSHCCLFSCEMHLWRWTLHCWTDEWRPSSDQYWTDEWRRVLTYTGLDACRRRLQTHRTKRNHHDSATHQLSEAFFNPASICCIHLLLCDETYIFDIDCYSVTRCNDCFPPKRFCNTNVAVWHTITFVIQVDFH